MQLFWSTDWGEATNWISWNRAITHTLLLKEKDASAISHLVPSLCHCWCPVITAWGRHPLLQSQHYWKVQMVIFLQWHSYAFAAFAPLIFYKNILIALLQFCRYHTAYHKYGVCVHYLIWHSRKQITYFSDINNEAGRGELVFFFLEYKIRTDEMQGSFCYDFCNFVEYLCSLVYIMKVCISKSSLTSEMKMH